MVKALPSTVNESNQLIPSGCAHRKMAPEAAARRQTPSMKANFKAMAKSVDGHALGEVSALGIRLRGLHESAVDLDRITPLQKFDGHHEQAFVRLAPDQDAFDIGERSPGDPHPLSLAEIRIREDRHTSPKDSLNGLDAVIRDDI